jgi:hypothetical protein
MCFVCQDKPLIQQRDGLGKMMQAIVDGWNSVVAPRHQFERIQACAPDRPPHSTGSLAHYALGPSADRLVGPVLGGLAIFMPDVYGNRLVHHGRRNELSLSEEGQKIGRHFLDVFFAIYPWGRAGVWLADQGGAMQRWELRLCEVSTVEELLGGPLEPNMVKLVRGTAVVQDDIEEG